MNMIELVRQWLYESKVRGVDVDDNTLLDIHGEILSKKPLLKSAFTEFYQDMALLCDRFLPAEGLEVELGSGAGFLKTIRPEVVTSDIRKSKRIDMELDAQAMSLEDESVRCIYAINVFHHLPDPALFLEELSRVLKVGGGCILIEPHIGFASALLHRYLHTDEHFDPDAPGWRTSDIHGPLSGANQALAHIVFERDKSLFEDRFGSRLEVVSTGYELNSLRYLLSGGLNFRQLLPSFMIRPLTIIERAFKPFAKHWSLHKVIVVRKK